MPARGTWRDGVVAAVTIPAVVAASALMEGAASALGSRHGIPDIVTGGVVLAAITSMPNAVAAVYLARRGRGPAAFSVALNSNTVNVLVGLMIPAVIAAGVSLTKDAALITAAYAGLTVVTLGAAWLRRGIGRWAGALIIALYLGFVVVLIGTA